MSEGGRPQMRAAAQGLRGTVALLLFLGLVVGAAMFGGCGIAGKANRSSNTNKTSPTPSTSTPAPTTPASVPPAQPVPRGTATPTLPLPRLDKVVQSDATQVSSSALTVFFTYDTTTDTTTQDAAVRAAPWMTAEFAASQRGAVLVSGPGAQWQLWTTHRAYTAPALEQGTESAPSDTPTTAYRQWLVRYAPVGRDGWQGEQTLVVAFVTLVRASANDPWRVSDLLMR